MIEAQISAFSAFEEQCRADKNQSTDLENTI